MDHVLVSSIEAMVLPNAAGEVVCQPSAAEFPLHFPSQNNTIDSTCHRRDLKNFYLFMKDPE